MNLGLDLFCVIAAIFMVSAGNAIISVVRRRRLERREKERSLRELEEERERKRALERARDRDPHYIAACKELDAEFPNIPPITPCEELCGPAGIAGYQSSPAMYLRQQGYQGSAQYGLQGYQGEVGNQGYQGYVCAADVLDKAAREIDSFSKEEGEEARRAELGVTVFSNYAPATILPKKKRGKVRICTDCKEPITPQNPGCSCGCNVHDSCMDKWSGVGTTEKIKRPVEVPAPPPMRLVRD